MELAVPLLIGIAIAVATGVLARKMFRQSTAVFATVMGATAFTYVGSAFAGGETHTYVLETAIALVLLGLTLAGVQRSAAFIALAFILHGGWDLLHVALGMGAPTGKALPAFCVAYDWVLAGIIFYTGSRAPADESSAAT